MSVLGSEKTATFECPFPDCEWSTDYDPDSETDRLSAEHQAEMHYEGEHAGRVRLQVTIEYDQLLSGRTAREAREGAYERFEERGHDVAHVRSEVLEETDDHSALEGGASE